MENMTQEMVRFRGEEMWVGTEHVANLRLSSNDFRPVAVQALDGEICFQASTRRAAEVWAKIHVFELRQRARSFTGAARV